MSYQCPYDRTALRSTEKWVRPIAAYAQPGETVLVGVVELLDCDFCGRHFQHHDEFLLTDQRVQTDMKGWGRVW